MTNWPEEKTGQTNGADALGFCDNCFRVRWLAVVERWEKAMPCGMCRQCDREGKEGTR